MEYSTAGSWFGNHLVTLLVNIFEYSIERLEVMTCYIEHCTAKMGTEERIKVIDAA